MEIILHHHINSCSCTSISQCWPPPTDTNTGQATWLTDYIGFSPWLDIIHKLSPKVRCLSSEILDLYTYVWYQNASHLAVFLVLLHRSPFCVCWKSTHTMSLPPSCFTAGMLWLMVSYHVLHIALNYSWIFSCVFHSIRSMFCSWSHAVFLAVTYFIALTCRPASAALTAVIQNVLPLQTWVLCHLSDLGSVPTCSVW